ncbi:MAG: VTT domain-containing protein [Candidatus Moranbacteria bacterium]|jgi:membrane-associated protein|nr:VTT domain-containing protein [Candidatus Moranbacteria bacterium]
MTFFGIDLVSLIETIGYAGVFGIVFAETGLFLGFFFPGDSLLFVAGFLASIGIFSLPWLLIGIFVSGVLGNVIGYEFGRRVGPKIFNREDSFLFKKAHVLKAQTFYEKHGSKTIVLARFMPIVRTFAPIVAGVANMNYRTFFIYNLAGSLLWTIGLVSLGYTLGSVIDVDRYLLPIVALIVIVSFLPGLVGYWREKQSSKAEESQNI